MKRLRGGLPSTAAAGATAHWCSSLLFHRWCTDAEHSKLSCGNDNNARQRREVGRDFGGWSAVYVCVCGL